MFDELKVFLAKKKLLPVVAVLKNLFFIAVGSFLFSFGAQAIAAKFGFLTGGIYGLGILIWYATEWLSPATWFFLINVPFFIFGYLQVGKRFFFYSLFATSMTTLFGEYITYMPQINNEFYAAVAAGVICGTGVGMVLRSFGAASALDIICIYLNRRFGIGIGQSSLIYNAVLFTLSIFTISLDMIIVSLIQVFLSTVTMEKTMSMFSERKVVFIVSNKVKEIAENITNKLGLGGTLIQARGAFSGDDKQMLMVVANKFMLKRLEDTTFTIDSTALFIVENTFQVRGHKKYQRLFSDGAKVC